MDTKEPTKPNNRQVKTQENMPQFKTANVFKRWNDLWHLLFGLQTLQLEYLSLKVKENLKRATRRWEDKC